jgi:hypothetical protein
MTDFVLDPREVQRLLIQQELAKWMPDLPLTGADRRPWGNSVELRTAGGTAFPPSMNQPLVQRVAYPPRQFNVKMRGLIQSGTPAGAGVLSMGTFRVETVTNNDQETYEIDAECGDSNLSVWAEQITVIPMWDLINATQPKEGPALQFPDVCVFSASIAEARSFGTARRTLVMDSTAVAVTGVLVPRGSRGVIIRTGAPYAATIGDLTWLSESGQTLDIVPAAAVKTAHDAGAYLSVPSWAFALTVSFLAVNAFVVLAEFEIRP